MRKSPIFLSDVYGNIETAILEMVNAQADFLSAKTSASPRAVGDVLQGIISENCQAILGAFCSKYSSEFARRAMADLAFEDREGFYYIVDVKTHREDTHFNMPNLTSVERLTRFYEDDKNYFVILMVRYRLEGMKLVATRAHFVPIEFLAWECLTIGALGWGQIQIANANTITIRERFSRKKWMLELCEIMLDFYPKEIQKIGVRIERFKTIKKLWESRPDD